MVHTDKIIVKFTGTIRTYTYSYDKDGVVHVTKMKILARNGRDLNSYINLHVRKSYDLSITNVLFGKGVKH